MRSPRRWLHDAIVTKSGSGWTASGQWSNLWTSPRLQALARTLADANIEAIAICLLHSYANPAHERRIAQLLRERLPNCFISVSSEVLPEIREYERTSTTVVNAYVGPVMSRYLQSLQERFASQGVKGRLLMMQSSGGTLDVQQVLAKPATVVESGPAAGVVLVPPAWARVADTRTSSPSIWEEPPPRPP